MNGQVRQVNQTASSTKAERISQIAESFNTHERELQRLKETVAELIKRLEPVTRCEPPEPSQEEANDPMTLVPVAIRIHDNTRLLRSVIETIDSIHKTLEL